MTAFRERLLGIRSAPLQRSAVHRVYGAKSGVQQRHSYISGLPAAGGAALPDPRGLQRAGGPLRIPGARNQQEIDDPVVLAYAALVGHLRAPASRGMLACLDLGARSNRAAFANHGYWGLWSAGHSARDRIVALGFDHPTKEQVAALGLICCGTPRARIRHGILELLPDPVWGVSLNDARDILAQRRRSSFPSGRQPLVSIGSVGVPSAAGLPNQRLQLAGAHTGGRPCEPGFRPVVERRIRNARALRPQLNREALGGGTFRGANR